jgi:predicted nucleic-acid-binding protein
VIFPSDLIGSDISANVGKHHDLVVKALRQVEQKNADFADALIAARSLREGCASIITFDRKAAARVPGMELLA